jgi:F0F1-type ATP synthase epsilon subunit
MLFLLATAEYNKVQSNTTRVKVHLRNGVAEIFDQHQDLMGKVENDLLEIETNFENKLEKFVYIVQDAVFIVSNEGLEVSSDSTKRTSVYVYANRIKEITSSTTVDEIVKQYEQKSNELEKEIEKAQLLSETEKKGNQVLNSRIYLLKEEVEFLQRAVTIIKNLKS